MQTTLHFDRRMNQRGIRKDIASLALLLGEMVGDKYILTTKIIDQELSALASHKRLLLDARKKGGVVVVGANDALLTTYRTENYKRKTQKNK